MIHFGPFSFRFDRGELRRGDEVVRITEREREILTILGSRAGDNVPREELAGNGIAANERTVDVQINRLRRKIEIDPANPDASSRPCAASAIASSSTDEDRRLTMRDHSSLDRVARWFGRFLPKGLYARSLIIIIAPVVLLQSVVAYVFMERHWQLVTRRLSSAVTADIAALIDIYESYPQDRNSATLARIASERLQLDVDILHDTDLPPPAPKPFFSILDETLSDELRRQIDRPYWIDTVGRSNFVEIRVKLERTTVMRVLARSSGLRLQLAHLPRLDGRLVAGPARRSRSCSCATRSGRSCGLRRRPKRFGKGREIEFRPRGAREVRQAGHAFLEMKRRIERNIEQRTTMLNGVSHDLRTILTRFKLSLALLSTDARGRGSQARHRRDEPHARGLSRLRPRRCRRAGGRRRICARCCEEVQSDAERQGHATSSTSSAIR